VTDVVEAARFNNRVEADLARLYLESEGVVGVLLMPTSTMFLAGSAPPCCLSG
jgi:hypothetical protein